MSKFLCHLGVIIATLIALAGCSSASGAEYLELGAGGAIDLEMLGLAEDAPDRGRILVWHDWPEPDSALLEELMVSYMKLFPDVHIVLKFVPANQILARYEEKAASGLGPDLLLGVEAHHLGGFARDGYLLNLAEYNFDSLHIQAEALDALRLEDDLYGVPLAGFTDVMYFNKKRVTEPIANLEELMGVAREGRRIGIPLGLFHAYWGVDAFNGSVFGEGNQLSPDEGFIAWLAWIVQVLGENSILFDTDYFQLREAFLNGELDYFVGSSHELPLFRERFSADYLGMAPLPGAINAEPGSFLEIEALAINRHSAKVELSLNLIQFLTNAPIQRRISHSGLGRIPMNTDVIIDERISPIEATLIRQEKRALVIPFHLADVQNHLFHLGSDIYDSVLHGVATPHEAAAQLQITIEH